MTETEACHFTCLHFHEYNKFASCIILSAHVYVFLYGQILSKHDKRYIFNVSGSNLFLRFYLFDCAEKKDPPESMACFVFLKNIAAGIKKTKNLLNERHV